MRDLYDRDSQGGIVNLIEDAVSSLTNSVLVVPGKFFGPRGTRVGSKGFDLGSSAISFAADFFTSSS